MKVRRKMLSATARRSHARFQCSGAGAHRRISDEADSRRRGVLRGRRRRHDRAHGHPAAQRAFRTAHRRGQPGGASGAMHARSWRGHSRTATRSSSLRSACSRSIRCSIRGCRMRRSRTSLRSCGWRKRLTSWSCIPPSERARCAILSCSPRSRPGQLNFASGGAGTGNHFSGELFKLAAGLDLVHVPYKGTGPALADVLGGQVQMMFSTLLPAMPHVKTGRLRALAVTTAHVPHRPLSCRRLPNRASRASRRRRGMHYSCPRQRARQSSNGCTRSSRQFCGSRDERAARQSGTEVVASTPQELTAYIRTGTSKWGKVAQQAGIKGE